MRYFTKEWRNNLSKSKIGKKLSQEHRDNIRNGLLGKKRPPFSSEWLDNMRKARLGKKLSPEVIEKIRKAKLEEKNPMWKGNFVGYSQLHTWVKNRLPKTLLCECCNKVPPLDLANKGIYNRELKNWEWLCRRCHMTKDGRIDKLNKIEMSPEIRAKISATLTGRKQNPRVKETGRLP